MWWSCSFRSWAFQAVLVFFSLHFKIVWWFRLFKEHYKWQGQLKLIFFPSKSNRIPHCWHGHRPSDGLILLLQPTCFCFFLLWELFLLDIRGLQWQISKMQISHLRSILRLSSFICSEMMEQKPALSVEYLFSWFYYSIGALEKQRSGFCGIMNFVFLNQDQVPLNLSVVLKKKNMVTWREKK